MKHGDDDRTADLFATRPPRPPTYRDAKRARDEGMTRAETRAKRERGDEWTESAAVWLWRCAAAVAPSDFLPEEAREFARARGFLESANAKAWGPAVLYAKRRGWIVKSGRMRPSRSSNLSDHATWILGPNRP